MLDPSHFVRVRGGWLVVRVVGAGRFMVYLYSLAFVAIFLSPRRGVFLWVSVQTGAYVEWGFEVP